MQMVKEQRTNNNGSNTHHHHHHHHHHGEDDDNSSSSNSKMTVMTYDKLKSTVSGSAVVVFSSPDCCMCHVAKRLLFSLGVGPTVVELDDAAAASVEDDVRGALCRLSGEKQPLPAIFVGGKFLGGIESLMAAHINGSLVPLLKEAGALWL